MYGAVERADWPWVALGVALALTVTFVVHSFVGTFVLGLFLYYATRPVYRRVQPRIGNESLAAGVALVLLALPVVALSGYALLVVVGQLDQVLDRSAADVLSALGVDPAVVPAVGSPAALLAVDWRQYLSADQILGLVRQAGDAVDLLADVGVALVHAFVVVAVAYYLLRDDDRIADWTLTRFDHDGTLRQYGTTVDDDLDTIFFGNILNAAITGGIGVVVYALLNAVAPPGLGIPAPALAGALAGAASLVPAVGMKVVYVPLALYLAGVSALDGFVGGWFVLAFAGVSFVVVDTIPDLVLRPYVTSGSLHVGGVILAYTLGPLLFGWYGLFLLPIVLVLVTRFASEVLPGLLDDGAGAGAESASADDRNGTAGDASSAPQRDASEGASDEGSESG